MCPSQRPSVGRSSQGFTLVEVVIAVAITSLLIATVAGALSFTLTQVPKEGAKLAVEGRHQLARYWISRDANSAQDFLPGTSPKYGTFLWRDFSGSGGVSKTYHVIYYYDSTLKTLMRDERQNGVLQATFQVAGDILQESDVAFAWSSGEGKVTVAISPVIQEAHAVGDISRAATLVAFLRNKREPTVSAPTTTVTLLSVADSRVNQNADNTNYGTATTMFVRSTTTGNPDANNRSFVRFDLSSVPAGAAIQSAIIRLRMDQAPSASRSYDSHRVTASWVETTITWNNQPGVDATATSTIASGTTANVWLEWDVTSDVQSFVSGTLTNYGWRTKDQVESASGDFSSRFRTREDSGTTNDPQLVVIYVP